MQNVIINKYGSETVKNFWMFIENLKFDSSTQSSVTVRASLLKKLTPALAGKYKDIADEFAFSLYRGAFYDKNSSYLYAAFNAVSKGFNFYVDCWNDIDKIEEIIKSTDQFNNFSTCIPTEDDYFHSVIPSPESIVEDYDEYDEIQTANGVIKGKPNKIDWNSIENL